MSTTKVFHRKTKKGSVVKIVREHYLREDIHCGRESCESCLKYKQSIESPFAPKAYLSDSPRLNISQLCPSAHYVVPDFGVVHNQIDVITDPYFGFDIILMQTVWDEIKRNITIYSRIKQLMSQKRFYIFLNEYNKQTFSERLFGETIAQYKQRLIKIASEWLQNHFNNEIKIVLLSNCTQIKENTQIYCFPIDEYVKSLNNSVNLIDKLADLSSTQEYSKDIKFLYEEHLPLSQIQTGIKSGKYFQSKFRTNPNNYLEATVNIALNKEDLIVLIPGRDNINRAVNEDIVAVELLPESEWKSKSDVVLLIDEEVEDDGDEKDSKEVINFLKKKNETVKRPTAKVVGIIKRNWRQYCGILRERNQNINTTALMSRYLFVPNDRNIPFIRVETRQYDALKSQRIVVAIDSWPRDSKYPKGHYVRALGDVGEKETENEVLLLENDVPHLEFSESVMSCLPKEGENWRISDKDLVNRTDLRNECICSVDPKGCTDIDDALHSKDLGNGLYEIGVHIADVSHFIRPNTALDKEAADRGTTVYLQDNRIDMIPALLSSNLCSLRENCDRLTFSVIWIIDANSAQIKSEKFVKSVIRSKAAMTYSEAQGILDSKRNDEIAQSLRRLNSIAKMLKQSRLENGALVLASLNEIKFVELDSETHENVLEIEAKEIVETNSLVEEFMLLANNSVAKKIFDTFPELALLRRHPKPNPANFEELITAAKGHGIEIDVSSNKKLSESLNRIRDAKNEYLNLLFRMLTTRCMTQALYFCTGSLTSGELFEHFGLATDRYTHFTSPIRRYADLMVHRLLSHAIEYEALDSSLLNKSKMHSLCEHINYRNYNSRRASRASTQLKAYLYIKQNSQNKIQETGYIFFVRKNALQILIPHLAIEVTYFLDPPQDWIYDELRFNQKYIPKDVVLNQFDSVTVQLSIDENKKSIRRKVITKLIKPFTVDTETIDTSVKKMKV
jgi:exosome complex exonuclease DIS3/RRP44